MPKPVRQVVWNEFVDDGEVRIILTCGHVLTRADFMATTTCEMCPENYNGDDAPLKCWRRISFLELGDGA